MTTTSNQAAPPVRTGAAVPPRRRRRDDRLVGWLFISPVLVGFAVFYLLPTLLGLYWSFTDYSLIGAPNWVGLQNYSDVLHDSEFWNSMRVTLYYVVSNVVAQTALALLLATLMFRLTRSVILRTTLLLPWLVPNVTVGLIWLWLLDTNLGFVNHVMNALGLPVLGFFTNPHLALPTISVVNVWAYTGYTALLFYAGMLQIPADIYESAALDGAGEWRLFRGITLPLLRPILALVLVVSLIGSFQIFDTVAITTKGGPVNATRVIFYYIYQEAFSYFSMGYAATMAIILVLILGTLTAVQLRLLRASQSELN